MAGPRSKRRAALQLRQRPLGNDAQRRVVTSIVQIGNLSCSVSELMHTRSVGPREEFRGNLKPSAVKAMKGFSLIELMVALVIASILLIALSSLFVNNTSARNELEKSSRQIENGRYAMQVLSDDIRHAGYYGPLISAPALPGSYANLPDACSTTTTTVRDGMGLPVQGYEGAATAAALDSGRLACLDTTAAGYKANTAVLVVRRAHTSIAGGVTANQFNIQVSGCAGDTQQFVMDAPGGTFNLHANTAPGCLPLSGAPGATICAVSDAHLLHQYLQPGQLCVRRGYRSHPEAHRHHPHIDRHYADRRRHREHAVRLRHRHLALRWCARRVYQRRDGACRSSPDASPNGPTSWPSASICSRATSSRRARSPTSRRIDWVP